MSFKLSTETHRQLDGVCVVMTSVAHAAADLMREPTQQRCLETKNALIRALAEVDRFDQYKRGH